MISIASKIDNLGLTTICIELRKGGMSLPKIRDIVNSKYLPPGSEQISLMAFQRWYDKHKGDVMKFDEHHEVVHEPEIDPYKQMKTLSETIEERIEHVKAAIKEKEELYAKEKAAKPELEPLANDEDWKDTQMLLNTLVNRKQSILNDIAKYQAEIATVENMRKAIRIMVDVLQGMGNGVYDTFKRRIETNPDLKNLCK